MNELQFIQYRYQLRLREKQSAKNLWLSTYCCFLYMLLKAFNITAKMIMSQIYLYLYSNEYSLNSSGDDIYFANVQWFCYEIAAPLSLPILAKVLVKAQFRVILFLSSLGSILFIAPLQYATLCKGVENSICNIYVMWAITLILSFFSGFCKALLLFTMLYYLSNLSGGKEKIIYYSFFYFMYVYFIHQLQWLIGSLIGNLIAHFCIRETIVETLNHFYIILIIGSVLLCCSFLTLPEESKKSRFKKFRSCISQLLTEKNIKNQKAQRLLEQQQLLPQDQEHKLNEKLLDLDEIQDEQECVQQALNHSKFELKTLSFLTIQCFSFEEIELQQILVHQQKSADELDWVYLNQSHISIDHYVQHSYYGNLYMTLTMLLLDGYINFIVLLFNIGCIYAYLLLQLPSWFNLNSQSDPQQEIVTLYEGFLYVGIGQIFGCFYMGLFGDFYQKITGLYYILGMYQFGCLLSWGIYLFQVDFLIFFMAFIFGFCCSAMMSTIVSFQLVQFKKFIYSVDLMYILFSISFSIASLIYITTNYTGKYNGLILLQCSGILGLLSTWRMHANLNFKLNKC